jgi:hypothetical protein
MESLLNSDRLSPSAPTWRVIWHDDFDGPEGTPLDHDRWHVITGKPWASGEESYADDTEHISLDGAGNLRVTATHTPDDGYVSAWIETRREDFRPEPGGALRVSARVRTAAGLGLDCAMFAWSELMRHRGDLEPRQAWYRSGEIDVFEIINSEPSTVWGVVHSPELRQLPSLGMGTSTTTPDGRPFSADFHEFTLVWTREPDSMTWYLDGEQYLRLTPEQTTPQGWIFDQRVFFGLLIVIGSPGGPVMPGEPDPSAFPVTMLVDRVTVAEAAAADLAP